MNDEDFYAPTIAFLHIPKCAGQSVVAAFRELFDPQTICSYYPPDDISSRSNVPPRLITGHFQYGYQFTRSNSVRTVTILRHPVDRLKSQLNFDRDVFYSDYGSRFPEIAEIFLQESDALTIIQRSKAWYYDNCMVRMLSGVGPTLPFGQVSDIHLEAAKRNLIKMEVVGFQDRMDDFASDMKRNFSFEYFNLPTINSQAARGTPVDFIQFSERALADVSSFDIQLWYWARDKYCK